MSKLKVIYYTGAIIIFLGLLWMLLPHVYHKAITDEKETSHLFHTIQGALAALIGISVLIITESLMKKRQQFINPKSQQSLWE